MDATQSVSASRYGVEFVAGVWWRQAAITLKVISGLYPGVTTVELDNLAAETAATMTTKYPDYAILAARIAVSNLHKETKKVFSGKESMLFSRFTFDATRLNAIFVDEVFFSPKLTRGHARLVWFQM